MTTPELRLVPAAIVVWLTAGVLIGAPEAAVAVAAAFGAATVGALAVVRRGGRRLVIVVIALVAGAVVTLSIAAREPGRSPELLRIAAAEGIVVELTAVVSAPADDGRLRLSLLAAEVGGEVSTAPAPLLLFGSPDDSGVAAARPGEVVRVAAGVEAAAPGDDVAFLAFPRGRLERVEDAPPVLAAADGLRAGFREAASAFPAPGSGLLPGLAIGDTSALPARLDADMRTAALSHLTAVSGANCAIVVGVALAIAGGLGARRGIRVGVALVSLAGFVVLVTPEPSVLRAAVMAAVALVALALGRPTRGIPLLCLAVIGLLAIDPWLARSYGFALSVLATAGLLVLAGPLARVLGRVIPAPLAGVLSVPFAAQLACQPVILLLDPTLPAYGVVANLLAAPAAPVATIVGLVACLVLPLAPPVGSALAALEWLPSTWIAATATFFAGLPAARLPWLDGIPGLVALVALEGAIVAALVVPPGSRVRRAAIAACALVATAYAAGLGGALVVDRGSRPPDWQYAACDVGQGDATVIRSAGRVAVVDVGPEAVPVDACLDDLGIDRIDLLVLTHFDLDHVGGVDAVVGRVDRVLVGPPADAADRRVLDALAAGGAAVSQVARGVAGTLGDLRWEVMWPPPTGVDPGNEASVVLAFRGVGACPDGCLSAVMLGDLGEQAQARLLGGARLDTVDVVKVAHHGSADQSTELYGRLSATVGLIGVGADNDYGHPSDRVLEILDASGTAAFRTDRHGLVLVAPGEGASVEVWTSRVTGPG